MFLRPLTCLCLRQKWFPTVLAEFSNELDYIFFPALVLNHSLPTHRGVQVIGDPHTGIALAESLDLWRDPCQWFPFSPLYWGHLLLAGLDLWGCLQGVFLWALTVFLSVQQSCRSPRVLSHWIENPFCKNTGLCKSCLGPCNSGSAPPVPGAGVCSLSPPWVSGQDLQL